MREVAPGDLIFSFIDTLIPGNRSCAILLLGKPKAPLNLEPRGNWENVGWKVRVAFTRLNHQVRPKDDIEVLRPFLPERYSPLQPNGNGNQGIYLTELSRELAEVLAGLIGEEARSLMAAVPIDAPMQTNDDLDYWEHRIEAGIEGDPSILSTERDAIVRARRGQGVFKERVMTIERHCRITGVESGPFGCEPLQTVARCHKLGTPQWRERASPDAEYRSSLRSRLHRVRKILVT